MASFSALFCVRLHFFPLESCAARNFSIWSFFCSAGGIPSVRIEMIRAVSRSEKDSPLADALLFKVIRAESILSGGVFFMYSENRERSSSFF